MIVVFYNSGQLGNRLFYFSHFIALGKATKQSVVFFCFKEYSSFFQGTKYNRTSVFGFNILKFNPFPFVRNVLEFLFYKMFLFTVKHKISNKFVSVYTPFLLGDMDSVEYSVQTIINDAQFKKSFITFYNGNYTWFDNTDFSKYRNELIPFFRPVVKYRDSIKSFVTALRANTDIVVGIHIRRGDYASFAGGKYFYSDDIYISILSQFQSLVSGRLTFVICSNETIDIEKYKDFNCVKSTGHFIEDMYILSECDYIIGPPSTFSAWASFYGQKPLYVVNKTSALLKMDNFKTIKNREYNV